MVLTLNYSFYFQVETEVTSPPPWLGLVVKDPRNWWTFAPREFKGGLETWEVLSLGV